MPSVSPCWTSFPPHSTSQSSTVRLDVIGADLNNRTSYAVQADSSSDDELMPAADGFQDRSARSLRGLVHVHVIESVLLHGCRRPTDVSAEFCCSLGRLDLKENF